MGRSIFVAGAIFSRSSRALAAYSGLISTGTPDGVGMAKGKYLKPGDVVEASIGGIGVLRNPVE